MNNQYFYKLELAGMRALYVMPHPVTIIDSGAPFMEEVEEICFASDAEKASLESSYDLIVHFRACSSLKKPSDDAFHVVDSYYSRQLPFRMDGHEVWRCTDLDGPVYAYVHWTDAMHAEVEFLPEYQSYLSLSRHLLNLTGIENWLLAHHGFMLHASLIGYEGKGILFSAPSGTGKSTQADLWVEHEGAEIINGDRAGIILENGRWMAYGLPFAGSSGIYKNQSVAVSMVVILEQGPDNVVNRLLPLQAEMLLYPQVITHRWDEGAANETFNHIEEFVGSVPIYRFSCRPDKAAVNTIKELLIN